MTKEHQHRILDAIADCDRFIAKEEPRRADLRPADVQKMLDHAITHRAAMIRMLATGN